MLQKIPLRPQSALGIFPGGAVSCVLFIDCSAYREGRRPDAINHSTWQRRAVLGVMVPQISMTEPGSLNARRQVAPAFIGGLSLSTALNQTEPPTRLLKEGLQRAILHGGILSYSPPASRLPALRWRRLQDRDRVRRQCANARFLRSRL